MSAMEPEIMVSVIVLTYNHEKYIRQALDSILMQKVDFKYEILVGDDCSTDETPSILLEYQNKYPDIFCARLRQKNIGATKNAYELHMDAKGKYIANLDGDDYWTDEDKLFLQVSFLESNNEFVGCSHKCRVVDENEKNLTNYNIDWIKYKEIFTLEDFSGIYLPGQISTYVRRNLYSIGNGIDYSILYKIHSMISDRIAVMLFLLQGNFYCMDRYMSCYRVSSSGNITSLVYKNNKKSIWDDCLITSEMEKYVQKNKLGNVNFFKWKQVLFVKAIGKMILRPEKKDAKLFIRYFLRNKDIFRYLGLVFHFV